MPTIPGWNEMHTIYIEEAIKDHPRTQRILQRVGKSANIISCKRYSEVFNPKAQNFRLQKQKPALILAEKKGQFALPTPEGFGIGGSQNYYFSHMLNCLYDCRYCFLQGMYSSANYVLFVNYEDFMEDIKAVAEQHADETLYFFSGYDCDSLAFEPVTHFLKDFLPFFAEQSNAILELRTKSANISALLRFDPFPNCIAAFSFTPDVISKQVEHKVPSVAKRIAAMAQLADKGWQVGLRFDPLIYAEDYQEQYAQLVDSIFQQVSGSAIHSVSIGPLRFPAKMYQKLVKLYPEDKLLAHPLEKRKNHFSYKEELEVAMRQHVQECLQPYVDDALLFACSPL